MFEPHPPIFIHDSGELTAYRSIEEALNDVEPWDVSESLEVFDAEGHRIIIRAEGVKRTKFTVGNGTTSFDDDSSGEHQPEILDAILRRYIDQVGASRVGLDGEQFAVSQLRDLVEALSRHFGV